MSGIEKYLWQGINMLCLDINVKKQMIAEGLTTTDFRKHSIERLHDIYHLAGGKESLESLTERIVPENWSDVADELIAEIKEGK